MTKLSVNINKIATLRNARGGNNPNLSQVAVDCQRFGADGITIHPRPDERHITTSDVYSLKSTITTEFNIEGYPDERFMKLISDVRPEQATLVPDGPDVLTSNAGWNTRKNAAFLKDVVAQLHSYGTRVSIFLDPDPELIQSAVETGTDRIELYTEQYARLYPTNPLAAISLYVSTAAAANNAGIGVNAGHDLDQHNLRYFCQNIPGLLEVSIGHALVSDALYFGLENAIAMYKRCLR